MTGSKYTSNAGFASVKNSLIEDCKVAAIWECATVAATLQIKKGGKTKKRRRHKGLWILLQTGARLQFAKFCNVETGKCSQIVNKSSPNVNPTLMISIINKAF